MALKKSLVCVMCVLVAAIVAAPIAEAQIGGIIGRILSNIPLIQGTIFCTLTGGIGVNGTSTPVFPNAVVQLQCANGNVVSSATTNSSGIFTILLNPITVLLTTLLQDCKLVVVTPLSSCNSALPSTGGLFSLLQLIGNTIVGLRNFINIAPAGFLYSPNLNV